MKKLFVLIGLAAITFGMSSCRKVCDCTTYQSGKSINNYLREKDSRDQSCKDLEDVYSTDSAKTIYMRCK